MFEHRIRQNKFRDLLILMDIISQKQTLATVNSLKVEEIILSKIRKLYRPPTPLPSSGWLVQHNTCLINSLKATSATKR